MGLRILMEKLERIRRGLNGLFGIHVWKSMRWIEDWVERPETPEEYRSRKPDMITIRLLGKVKTFRIPWR